MHCAKSVVLGTKKLSANLDKRGTCMSIIARLHGLCSDDLTRIKIYVK